MATEEEKQRLSARVDMLGQWVEIPSKGVDTQWLLVCKEPGGDWVECTRSANTDQVDAIGMLSAAQCALIVDVECEVDTPVGFKAPSQ